MPPSLGLRRWLETGLLLIFGGLAATLVIWLPLQRAFQRQLQSVLILILRRPRWAQWVYALIFLPGVALHEVSHWLAARLLRVRTLRLSLLPRTHRDGLLRLGYVETEASDPIRAALIGAAPMVTGGALLAYVAFVVLGLHELVRLALQSQVEGAWLQLAQLGSPLQLMVWAYLLVAVSNTMLPSATDRRAWPVVLIILAVLVAAVYLVGYASQAAAVLLPPLASLAQALSGVFALAALADAAVLIPLLLMRSLLSRLLGWDVA